VFFEETYEYELSPKLFFCPRTEEEEEEELLDHPERARQRQESETYNDESAIHTHWTQVSSVGFYVI